MNDMERKRYAVNAKPEPLMRPGELYSREQVLSILGVTNKSLQRWEQNGLVVMSPGIRSAFYLSDHVIAFMIQHASGETLKPLVPNYKRKQQEEDVNESVCDASSQSEVL